MKKTEFSIDAENQNYIVLINTGPVVTITACDTLQEAYELLRREYISFAPNVWENRSLRSMISSLEEHYEGGEICLWTVLNASTMESIGKEDIFVYDRNRE